MTAVWIMLFVCMTGTDDCGKLDGSAEVGGQLVVAGGDAAES